MCDNRLNDMLMNTRRAIAIVEKVAGAKSERELVYGVLKHPELAVGDSVYNMRSVLDGLNEVEEFLRGAGTIDMEETT